MIDISKKKNLNSFKKASRLAENDKEVNFKLKFFEKEKR